jgi:hypothetical protein
VFFIGDSSLPLRACTFFLLCLQFAEQGVQALEIRLPNTAVAFEPGLELLERGGAQGIDAALRVDANVHEAGLAEDAEVLGDLGLAETEAADRVADGARSAAEELDDVKAVRLGEGAKCGGHNEC